MSGVTIFDKLMDAIMRQAVEMALICLGIPPENSWMRSLTAESKTLSEAPEDFRWKSM